MEVEVGGVTGGVEVGVIGGGTMIGGVEVGVEVGVGGGTMMIGGVDVGVEVGVMTGGGVGRLSVVNV